MTQPTGPIYDKLKALGITSKTRIRALPDVPPIGDAPIDA